VDTDLTDLTDLEALRAELQRLRDHEEIRQLLYRYARGVDRADLDLIRSVYAADGTDHHGAFDGPGRDFAQVVCDKATETWDTVGNHHITNVLIEVDGDQAKAEVYFLALHPHHRDGTTLMAVMSGRYIDQLERADGKWGIKRRRVITDLSRNHLGGPEWQNVSPDNGYLAGRRGNTDPSYELFPAGD
jgi:hypothetical protein